MISFGFLSMYRDERGEELAGRIARVLSNTYGFIYHKSQEKGLTLYVWSGVIDQIVEIVQEITGKEFDTVPSPLTQEEIYGFKNPAELGENREELEHFFLESSFSVDYDDWVVLDSTIERPGNCFGGLLVRWYYDYGSSVPNIVAK